MQVTLPDDLQDLLRQELASGRYRSADELVERAVRQLIDDNRRAQERLDALRRIGSAVDECSLYDRVLIPYE
jgi:putative addiction module CopG family antidote